MRAPSEPSPLRGTFRGQESDGSSIDYAKSIIAKAAELEVSVLAITDHNSVNSITEFRIAAEDNEITIFPGFEITSSEGIHVLCIYPPDTAEERLERFLGELGIRSPEPPPICPASRSNRFSRKSKNKGASPSLRT